MTVALTNRSRALSVISNEQRADAVKQLQEIRELAVELKQVSDRFVREAERVIARDGGMHA
jgi:hypothetical protein